MRAPCAPAAAPAAAVPPPPWRAAPRAAARARGRRCGARRRARAKQHEAAFDVLACAETIAASSKNGQWELALSLLTQAQRRRADQDLPLYTGTIAACSRAKEWTQAWRRGLVLFRELPRRRLRPDAATYRALLRSLPGESWRLALGLLGELLRSGLRPCAATYDAAMRTCQSEGHWEQALWLLREAQSSGISLSVDMYSSVMWACRVINWWADPGGWQTAMMLFFEEMRKEGLAADALAFHAALANCPRSHWTLALQLLEAMRAQGLEPGRRHFNSAIAACNRAREWLHSMRLLEHMRQTRVHRDVRTYNAVLWALVRGRPWQAGLDLFSQLQRSEHIAADTVTYNSVINLCVQESNWCRALNFWFEMQKERVTPDWDTYTALLRVSEHCERWGWSRQLLDTLYNLGAPRNTEIYNAAINACRRSKRWAMALTLFRDMRAESISATLDTHAYLVQALEEGGRFDVALELMELIDDKSQKL